MPSAQNRRPGRDPLEGVSPAGSGCTGPSKPLLLPEPGKGARFPRLKIGGHRRVLAPAADDTGPRESRDTRQAQSSPWATGQGRRREAQGRPPGKSREAGEGGGNGFPVSQEGTTAVTPGGGEGETGSNPPTRALSAESKQAVRNMRPLKIQ